MNLVLTTQDQEHLSRVMTLLASPLEATSVDGWRGDVLRALAPLFSADAAAFVYPGDEGSSVTLLNRPRSYVEDYARVQAIDEASALWTETDQVETTESLGRRLGLTFSNTEIYAAFYDRYEVRDGVFAILGLAEKPPMIAPGIPFQPGGKALQGLVCLYGDRPGRPRLSADGARLMRLLVPAIRSAAQSWKDLGERRAELLRLIDQSSDALSIHSNTGKTLHRNPAFRALQDRDPRFGVVDQLADLMAVGTVALGGDSPLSLAHQALERECSSGVQRYRLRATRTAALLGPRPVVVVHVQPLTLPLPATGDIKRFGLTAREAEVAQLLARGESNKSIAATLGVTEFTARRHSENIFRKLGVTSRSQVAARLILPDG